VYTRLPSEKVLVPVPHSSARNQFNYDPLTFTNVTGLSVVMGSCVYKCVPLTGALDTVASGKRKVTPLGFYKFDRQPLENAKLVTFLLI